MYFLLIIPAFLSFLLLLLMWKLLRIQNFATLSRVWSDLTKTKKPYLVSLFQVDTESTRNGGELVADVLKAHGIQEVFTLCGGHISPILVGCESLGIRIYDTRHEANAVFAADAVARLRGNVGVAAVTAGPGITNSVTAMKNAQLAESPVLLLGGASPSLLKGRGALQDIDQEVLLKPICKFTARVRRVCDIVPVLRKAISIAKSGTPGPVFVELPIEVLYPYKLVEREAGLSKNPKGLKKLVDFFIRLCLFRVFGSAWLPQDLNPLSVEFPKPKREKIAHFKDFLLDAKRPLLLIGSQAMCPPVKADDLANAVLKLGVPAYLGGMARGLLGANCPLQMRQCRKEALQNADLVILAGAVCDFRLGYGRVLNPNSKIVTINRDKKQMLKNHGLFWRSELAIQADVATTICEIQQAIVDAQKEWNGAPQEWLDELNDRERQKQEQNAAKMLESTSDGKLNPLLVLHQLDRALPDDTILVADGGDFVGSAAYVVRPRGPLQWLDPGAFGTLGVGTGFALGAKAVYPNRPVVILWGDGSCGFSFMEYDTFVRHKMAVMAIIGNDACWTQIARDQVPMFNSIAGCQLDYTNYEKVAEGLGAEGVRIEASADRDDIYHMLKNALDQISSQSPSTKPMVMNVIIGKTNFREGSISV